jgi:PelA/Pel-15E family pectate lyase
MTHLIRSIFLTALLAGMPVSDSTAEVRWGSSALKQRPAWYATVEAREAAAVLLRYQSPAGAWPKNTDLFEPLDDEAAERIHNGGEANTIDNGATTTPLRFLARVIDATDGPAAKQEPEQQKLERAFNRGLDYLLEAQYANGGWPQFYPLRPRGYYSHITLNDGAMIGVMELLRDVAAGEAPFGFVDDTQRDRAAAAVARGVDCLLKLQVVGPDGPTAWCAQHDADTLEPAWARAYEPPSLSGSESVGVVRFLMSIERPSPEVIAAIDGAVRWFEGAAIEGQRLERFRDDNGRRDIRAVADQNAPPLWARFYELETNRPLFLDRDSVFRYDFSAVSYERRRGYSYLGDWPAKLIERDYPRWKERVGRDAIED